MKPFHNGTIALVFLVAFAGCGKPSAETEAAKKEEQIADLTFVKGSARFANQCPYGNMARPYDEKLNLWYCPLGLSEVELVQPLRTLVFQADCKKRLVTLRTTDGRLDTMWEALPDGSFYFSVDGGFAQLLNDGSGNAGCYVPLTAEISGKMECQDRDRAILKTEVVWWLDKPLEGAAAAAAARSRDATPAGPKCKVPKGCYFFASTEINQCG